MTYRRSEASRRAWRVRKRMDKARREVTPDPTRLGLTQLLKPSNLAVMSMADSRFAQGTMRSKLGDLRARLFTAKRALKQNARELAELETFLEDWQKNLAVAEIEFTFKRRLTELGYVTDRRAD